MPQLLTRLARSRSNLARSGIDLRSANRRLARLLAEFEGVKWGPSAPIRPPSRESILSAIYSVLDLADDGTVLDEASLRSVHTQLDPESAVLRFSSGVVLCPNHKPLPAAFVPKALERFFDWIGSPGFEELHPVEQMTLCQIRLLEISPFEHGSPTTASVMAAYFPIRERFLLPYFAPHQTDRFRDCLSRALAFSTADLVEFNLSACQAAYDELLRVPLS